MSKRNENRKGYKRTPLGWIPEEWEAKPLKRQINLVNGMAFQPKDWGEKGLPIIRIQNLNDSSAQFNYFDGTVEERYFVDNGDLLFAWSGTKGISFGIRIWERGKAILNQHIFRVIPDESKIAQRFAFYSLKKAQVDIESRAHGFKSSFVHVKKGDLEKTIIAIPPLPEQQKIAAILSTWDEAISQTQQLLEQLKTRNRGLMQELLTGKRRLKDYKERWEKIKFAQLFKPVALRAENEKSTLLSVTKNGIVAQANYFNKSIASEDLSNYLVVNKGNMVMSGLNFWMGSIDVLTDFDRGLVSPAYKVFQVNELYLDPSFARFFVRSRILLSALIGSSIIGASIVRRNLDREMLSEWSFNLPGLSEQKSIATVLDAATQEMKKYEQRLAQLQLQKKGLMQKLLTGEVRVKV